MSEGEPCATPSKQASSLRQKPTSINYLKNLVPIGQEEGQPLGTLVELDIPVMCFIY